MNKEPYRINRIDVAGAVILYNSPTETLKNINTYVNQVEKLYVIDNSDRPNYDLINSLNNYSNVEYCSLNGNIGIAAALNRAAQQAIQEKFQVLITMDDDTSTPDTMVSSMLSFWNSYPQSIGILSGVHHIKRDDVPYRILLYTLTSGNMLNLRAYQDIGGFQDDLFIDHVDHEYGMRLSSNGYQVIELPGIRLNHRLGCSKLIKIGSWVVMSYGTHSPLRLYYFTRNGIYIARKYIRSQPLFAWRLIKELVKRCVKALFLDEEKGIRLKMLLRGVKDASVGRLGKYTK